MPLLPRSGSNGRAVACAPVDFGDVPTTGFVEGALDADAEFEGFADGGTMEAAAVADEGAGVGAAEAVGAVGELVSCEDFDARRTTPSRPSATPATPAITNG
jgi:hypothetical protein